MRLVTVNDGPIDWEDFTGRVMFSLKQEGKNQFLKDLSRNVTRGIGSAIKEGYRVARAPYGFALESVVVPGRPRPRKRLVLGDLAKQKIVQRIFAEFVQDGRSIHSIKDRLNADGIAPPSGKKWRFETTKGAGRT